MHEIKVTFTDGEMNLLEKIAKAEGISESELVKQWVLESLEDLVDAMDADKEYAEHLATPETLSHAELMKKLNLK